jgi:hypothetical protein
MTAADYCDWCTYAGLYVQNVSHADRYRTYQGKISRQGLAVKIVLDLLENNKGGLDLQTWRNSDVYEFGDDATYRVEQTALALEAVGAPRAAAKIRTLKNTSMSGMLMDSMGDLGDYESAMDMMKNVDPAKMMEEFRANLARAMPDLAAQAGMPIPEQKPVPPDQDIESWEQVEHLLQKYVDANEAALRADLAKHGDPRAQPGFDPEHRMAELERLRMRENDRELQLEHVPKARKAMESIDKQVAKNPKIKPGKVAKARREFLEHFRAYADRDASELLPETQKWLDDARAFQDKHQAIFKPKPIDDAKLFKRLEAIGDYTTDMGKKQVSLSWTKPAGLTCDWTEFSFSLQYKIGDATTLTALLDAYDRMKAKFAKLSDEVKAEVLKSFDIHREFVSQLGGFDDYDLDDDGNPTEESIFQHAGVGAIHLSAGEYDEEWEDLPEAGEASPFARVYFSVDWDEEHGLDTFLDVEPEAAPVTGDFTLPAGVKFSNPGPAFKEPALAAFEKAHNVKLPADYRQFLLLQNGGEPEPNHLKAKMRDGPAVPVYVEMLFSVEPPSQPLENGLGAAIDLFRAEDKPASFVPIGRVRMAGFGDSPMRADLLIAVSGKQAGKVLVAMSMHAAMMAQAGPGVEAMAQMGAMMAMMYEESCMVIAPSFTEFLARLTPAKTDTIPVWLQAIRAGDVDAFQKWLQAKGKLSEMYVPYGGVRSLNVIDYLAMEAPAAMLQTLVDQKVVNRNQLRASWQRWDTKIARFRELLPVLGKNAMQFAFSAPGIWDDAEFLKELLAAGINLDIAVGEEGETPLHLAIQHRRPDAVKWLLEHGATSGKPDQYGRTGILWAESERDLESLKLLIEAGEKLESLFPHMPTIEDKLRLIKSRWFGQFDALAEYLRSRGIEVKV